jgi:hypothetical protein
VFLLSVAAFAFSIHSFRAQEKRLQAELLLHQTSLRQQREMDSFKRLVELLPKIGCKADPQREIALGLLKADAPERLRLVLPVLEKCSATTVRATRQLQILKQEAENAEFESAFVFIVGNGRQYLLNGLPGAAARTFDAAADSIPRTYVASGVLDLNQVSTARRAFADGRFSEAADLFSNAYRKVPTDTAFDSSAFRGEPHSKITHLGNKGDAK